MTSRSADSVVVGRVGRAHGLRGDVTIEVRTDEPELRFTPGAQLRADDGTSWTVTAARWHSGRLLVRFDRCPDRTAAEAVRGTLLSAPVSEADRPDDPDEFYVRALIGLAARTVAGVVVGTVTEVLALPAQDVAVVTREDGNECLVPFVKEIVVGVDLDEGIFLIDPPAGLLELADAEPQPPPETRATQADHAEAP